MSRIEEVALPSVVARSIPSARCFRMGACSILLSREELPGLVTTLRWHLSIAHPARYPTWAEIGEARDRLIPPGVCLCIPFPPRAWWMSIHPNCFHLWEILDGALVDSWRQDGEQARALGYGAPTPEGRV